MSEVIEILEKQLEIEKSNVSEKLTTSNLDIMFKLTSTIRNLKKMECNVVEVAEDIVKKYSNGRYDHNIDSLYDSYIGAKQAYQQNGDQGHKDKLIEAVGRLMVEVYDMLSAMILDADFQDEKKEIMQRIKMLVE